MKDAKKTRESGFTLIEMMIVGVIISIGTALAVPAYVQWNDRRQLKEATRTVANYITLARMAAVNRNATVTVNVVPAGSLLTVNSGGVLNAEALPRFAAGFTGAAVQINSLGLRVSGTAGATQTLQLTSTGNLTYSIAITPVAKVNWCPKSTCP